MKIEIQERTLYDLNISFPENAWNIFVLLYEIVIPGLKHILGNCNSIRACIFQISLAWHNSCHIFQITLARHNSCHIFQMTLARHNSCHIFQITLARDTSWQEAHLFSVRYYYYYYFDGGIVLQYIIKHSTLLFWSI